MDDRDMPSGSHVVTLRGRLRWMNLPYEVRVVWLDRGDECPRCGQYVDPNPGCPVAVDEGAGSWAQLAEWDKMHHCGEWLSVVWRELEDGEGAATAALDLLNGEGSNE